VVKRVIYFGTDEVLLYTEKHRARSMVNTGLLE
jgi:hypothetical protein